MRMRLVLLSLAVGLAGCPKKEEAPKPAPKKPLTLEQAEALQPLTYDSLLRVDFNRRAQALDLPLFWGADANHDKKISPDELWVLWTPQRATRADYVQGDAFTKKFDQAYRAMMKPDDFSKLSPAERERRQLEKQELDQGQPTLVSYDATQASPGDQQLIAHLLEAARLVERLYQRQLGSLQYVDQLPKDDPAAHALFNRNQGPWCVAPQTEKNPKCSALPTPVPHLSGLYPAAVQKDPGFCALLEKQPNGKALMDHFSAVEQDGKGFKAVPYNVAWKDDMEAVAKELEAAAAALGEDEAPFKKYLLADAQAFRTNDWEPANEAWAAMGTDNSKWYLRAGPDEVYYEPCAWKAGFAVNFSRINPDSVAWQKKLEPVKQEMEAALARLAGAPYKARKVKFKLPDFIDVVLNAGDQRNAHGATIGESLPNWGPVAARGGRTVVMTNLYTDPDSQAALKAQMASLFCKETMKQATTDPAPQLMGVVLHEAAHNLGPAHEYKVKGKVDDEIFGGTLASTLEELKAQTSALYFTEWLAKKKLITEELAQQAHVRDVAWAFGHISRGMYTADGKPRNYSQLASIQLGTLFKAGALIWRADQQADNGSDQGCFDLDFKKWTPTIDALEQRVLKVKARGDKKDAEALKAEFVDQDDAWKKLKDTIAERWLRAPKATFVYSVRLPAPAAPTRNP